MRPSLLGMMTVACVATVSFLPQRSELGDRERCRSYSGVPHGWPSDPDAGMVEIEGGTFVPGSTKGYADERPGDPVEVEPFLIDRTEVTNAQFAEFVTQTGYVTVAQRRGGAPVFRVPTESERADWWWTFREGASFRHPEGPDSAIVGQANDPVVQVAYEDALAYALWLGHALPSEAQWEFAARAGRTDASLHGAPRGPDGEPTANFWQGEFPRENVAEDGFVSRAPVGCFPANGFGVYDSIGNVWEWTRDAYRSRDQLEPDRLDPDAAVPRVIKGGSFLCSPNFCARYRVSARHRQEPDMTGVHLGFRTIKPL